MYLFYIHIGLHDKTVKDNVQFWLNKPQCKFYMYRKRATQPHYLNGLERIVCTLI